MKKQWNNFMVGDYHSMRNYIKELQHQGDCKSLCQKNICFYFPVPLPLWYKQLITLVVQPSGYACCEDQVHLQFLSIQNDARWMSIFGTTFSDCRALDGPGIISDQVKNWPNEKNPRKYYKIEQLVRSSKSLAEGNLSKNLIILPFLGGPLQSPQPPCAQEFLFCREFCWTNLIF